MTQEGYALVGLTAFVAMLVTMMTWAVLRFASGARDAGKHLREGGADTALLSAALQEAVMKLKAQEKAMSARAAASEQLSGEIVESLTAGLLVVDASGRIDIFNPAGRRMLEVSGEPVGADYHEVLADVQPLAEVIQECLDVGRPILRRSVQTQAADRRMHFGVSVSPLAGGGPEGPPLRNGPAASAAASAPGEGPPLRERRGVICLFSDLTAVIDLEEQLRFKDTLARLGELTAGIAHEFRNGLATIHGYSRLIDPQALPPKYQPYVEGIRQETEALGQVVTNFLNFARPEQVSFSLVDLGAVVRRAADDLRHELPEGASLTVAGTFGDVLGDEVLLRQVFGNLVRNAVEACEVGDTPPVVQIEGDCDLGQGISRVTVEDNGPGIPTDARERIFQPFFTTRSRGTGLGLSIVQKIVVMHNGRVAARDTPAGGANIEVVLPLADA